MKALDKTIESLLAQAGVNSSERTVYMAGEGAVRTSKELVSLTKMPRPTVLAALSELRSLGLCEIKHLDGRSYSYSMLPLVQLKTALGERILKIEQLMQQIDSVDQGKATLDAEEYDGQEQVQKALELALRCKSREWKVIAPRNNAISAMPRSYVDYFKKTRKARQISSQTLWDADWSNKTLDLHDVLMRKPRYIPKDLNETIPSMLIAFDDKLLAIEGTKNPSAVLISSASVIGTFTILFEIAWRSCR